MWRCVNSHVRELPGLFQLYTEFSFYSPLLRLLEINNTHEHHACSSLHSIEFQVFILPWLDSVFSFVFLFVFFLAVYERNVRHNIWSHSSLGRGTGESRFYCGRNLIFFSARITLNLEEYSSCWNRRNQTSQCVHVAAMDQKAKLPNIWILVAVQQYSHGNECGAINYCPTPKIKQR